MKIAQAWLFFSLVFVCQLLSYPQNPTAQQKEPPATRLETVLVTKGNLIIKETHEIGGFDFGNVKFDALFIYLQGREDIKTKGIRVTLRDPKVKSQSHTVLLDLDEISSLKNSVDYMIEMAPKLKTGEEEIDIIYSSKDDLNVALNSAPGIQTLVIWKAPYINDAQRFDIKMLSSISAFMEKGLEILK